MYQKPDFVKVSVKVKDVFANYTVKNCNMDETLMQWMLADVGSCKEQMVTYADMPWGYQCYSTETA